MFNWFRQLLKFNKVPDLTGLTDLTGLSDKQLIEALSEPEFLNEWRCISCNAEGRYVQQIGPEYGQKSYRLKLDCGRDRSNDEYSVACPLIPIDSHGKEISFEEWERLK